MHFQDFFVLAIENCHKKTSSKAQGGPCKCMAAILEYRHINKSLQGITGFKWGSNKCYYVLRSVQCSLSFSRGNWKRTPHSQLGYAQCSRLLWKHTSHIVSISLQLILTPIYFFNCFYVLIQSIHDAWWSDAYTVFLLRS